MREREREGREGRQTDRHSDRQTEIEREGGRGRERERRAERGSE